MSFSMLAVFVSMGCCGSTDAEAGDPRTASSSEGHDGLGWAEGDGRVRVTGFNHVTIGVADLAASLEFYQGTLGMAVAHRGDHDAYLEWGEAWICLIERGPTASPPQAGASGVDHVAFSIADADFDGTVELLRSAGCASSADPNGGGLGGAPPSSTPTVRNSSSTPPTSPVAYQPSGEVPAAGYPGGGQPDRRPLRSNHHAAPRFVDPPEGFRNPGRELSLLSPWRAEARVVMPGG